MTDQNVEDNGTIGVIEAQRIMKLIPHRYPMLMVDRILEGEPGEHIVGLKNVTVNEPWAQGHFPGNLIFPAVLITEAIAQVGAIFAKLTDPNLEDKLIVFTGIDAARFRSMVVPGDQLLIRLEVKKRKPILWVMKAWVHVGDRVVVKDAEVIASIVDIPK